MMLVRGTGLAPKQKLLYKCKLHRCLVAQERHVYYMLSFIILNNYFCLFCVLNRIGRNKIIIKRARVMEIGVGVGIFEQE